MPSDATLARPDDELPADHIFDPDDPIDSAIDQVARGGVTPARQIYEARQFTLAGGAPVEITGYMGVDSQEIEMLVGTATFRGEYAGLEKKETVGAPVELLTDCGTLDEGFARLEVWYEKMRFERESKLAGECRVLYAQIEAQSKKLSLPRN